MAKPRYRSPTLQEEHGFLFLIRGLIWLWVNRYPTWNPGKWNGPNPAVHILVALFSQLEPFPYCATHILWFLAMPIFRVSTKRDAHPSHGMWRCCSSCSRWVSPWWCARLCRATSWTSPATWTRASRSGAPRAPGLETKPGPLTIWRLVSGIGNGQHPFCVWDVALFHLRTFWPSWGGLPSGEVNALYGSFSKSLYTTFEITHSGSWPSKVRPVIDKARESARSRGVRGWLLVLGTKGTFFVLALRKPKGKAFLGLHVWPTQSWVDRWVAL